MMKSIPYEILDFVDYKNFNNYVLEMYKNSTASMNLTFDSFIQSHVDYIRKNPQKLFSEISKQNSNYDQPCFDILIEYLVRSVEIPDKGYSSHKNDRIPVNSIIIKYYFFPQIFLSL